MAVTQAASLSAGVPEARPAARPPRRPRAHPPEVERRPSLLLPLPALLRHLPVVRHRLHGRFNAALRANVQVINTTLRANVQVIKTTLRANF